MRRLLLLCVVVVGLSACHAPVTIVTLQGQQSYTADQVVIRVNELQNAAIQANATAPQALSTDLTRVIVTFAVSADQTLATVPNGWQQTVKTGWATAKAQLSSVTNPLILALMAAVDAVMAGIS